MVNRVKQMKDIQQEALELFTKKNKDYGDAFSSYGPIGVIIRMQDKIERLISVNKNSIVLVGNETIRDTLIDLHNYAAMTIMTIDDNDKQNLDECE